MSLISQRTQKVLGALVVVGLVAGAARSARAADKYTAGKVQEIIVNPNGDFYFNLENYPPLCNTAQTNDARQWLTVTSNYANSDGKKNLLSTLTSAKLSGRAVSVRGLNNTVSTEYGCRLEGLDFL